MRLLAASDFVHSTVIPPLGFPQRKGNYSISDVLYGFITYDEIHQKIHVTPP